MKESTHISEKVNTEQNKSIIKDFSFDTSLAIGTICALFVDRFSNVHHNEVAFLLLFISCVSFTITFSRIIFLSYNPKKKTHKTIILLIYFLLLILLSFYLLYYFYEYYSVQINLSFLIKSFNQVTFYILNLSIWSLNFEINIWLFIVTILILFFIYLLFRKHKISYYTKSYSTVKWRMTPV